jgi:hypothetical protein
MGALLELVLCFAIICCDAHSSLHSTQANKLITSRCAAVAKKMMMSVMGKMFHGPDNTAFQVLWSEHARVIKESNPPTADNTDLQEQTCMRLVQVLQDPKYRGLKDRVSAPAG